MIKHVLCFLSRFSVKTKIAFLIVFLICGVVIWNVSYMQEIVERNEKAQKVLSSFKTAQMLNTLLFSLQKERAYSIAAENENNKEILKKIRKETDEHLSKYFAHTKILKTVESKNIDEKIVLLRDKVSDLKKIRADIDAKKIVGEEIIRYYRDSLIKHFIELITIMTAHIESNDFNAYFNFISAIEYLSLEHALIQVAIVQDKEFNQLWYDLILTHKAKREAYIDRFKTFAKPEVIAAYNKLYSTPAFISLTKVLEELKSQVGDKIEGIDEDSWLKLYDEYVKNIKEVESLSSTIVKTKIEAVLQSNSDIYRRSVLMLVIPMFFVLISAWLIFIDIRISLHTLLGFLKANDIDRENQVLLLKSKSEFGAIYRTLFAFNTKIKDQIKVIEKTYETDQLTGIPNRNKLLKEMKQKQYSGQDFTIIYIDIHNFSYINDSFGQDIGDIYLQETAKVLYQIAGSISSDAVLEKNVFRMGSDEFVLICSHLEYINLLISKLKEIYIIRHDSVDMLLSFTFGIASSSDIKDSESSMLSRAEIASRFAIKNHKRYEHYDKEAHLERYHKANLEWIKKIAQAFSDNLFVVHFQAIARAADKEVLKYEVLIRMYDNEKELMISPGEFLSVLQNTGHEKELTKLIINQSFKVYENVKVDISINMTRDDLDDDMLDYLIAKSTKHSISAESIVIELVESEELLKEKYIRIIQEIKRAGFKIAIDDFGTGYSNFAYLTEIKPDYIKIDGSLVQNIHTKEGYKVVEGIYNFAKNLGIEVIAEFVSSEEIYEKVKSIGIEYAQGYHIGYVISYDEIIKIGDKVGK